MEDSLNKLVDYLKNHPVKLIGKNDDGRVNSTLDEETVIEELQKHFGTEVVESPKKREWYDIAVNDAGNKAFVNIKISDLDNSAADNLSSKIGMGYALTGKILPNSWKPFNKMLVENITYGYDYYFIIVNKSDTSDVFWTSLKRIEKLVSNGNNLPFQCDWSKNRIPANRTEKEATKYILEQYLSSWDKKVGSYPFEIKKFLSFFDKYCQ